MLHHFDVIIIGGGINGAGIARDCALRGLTTLIVDKNDFASGASSRSTKLIHGGIRYLENFQFRLVWQACHERKILTKIAPHLIKTIPFIIPSYKGDKRPLWLIRLGMLLYDLMAGFKNIHRHKNLSAKKILQLIPGLKKEGLRGGGIYYDCQTNDARLTLANIQDAIRHGAIAKNYTEAATIRLDSGLAASSPSTQMHDLPSQPVASMSAGTSHLLEVTCRDTLTGEKSTFTTNFLVNATGPWLDQNLEHWRLSTTKNLRLTKGIHFFIHRPKLAATAQKSEEYALLCMAQKDNRIFFIIPHGEYSLIGTTDTDFKKSPDDVKVDKSDIEYLLKELNRLFPDRNFTCHDIFGEYAGLRPLLQPTDTKRATQKQAAALAQTKAQTGASGFHTARKSTGTVSREYQLKEDRKGDKTILHILGGKLTIYRHLAEKVTDRIVRRLANGGLANGGLANGGLANGRLANGGLANGRLKSQTAVKKLPGSQFPQKIFQQFRTALLRDNPTLANLPEDVSGNLIKTYGSEINKFLPYLRLAATPSTAAGHAPASTAAGLAPAPTAPPVPTPATAAGLAPASTAPPVLTPATAAGLAPASTAPPVLTPAAAPTPTQKIIPENPVIWAQLSYGLDHEFVRTPEDFIYRRTELYLHLKKYPRLSDLIAAELTVRSPLEA